VVGEKIAYQNPKAPCHLIHLTRGRKKYPEKNRKKQKTIDLVSKLHFCFKPLNCSFVILNTKEEQTKAVTKMNLQMK